MHLFQFPCPEYFFKGDEHDHDDGQRPQLQDIVLQINGNVVAKSRENLNRAGEFIIVILQLLRVGAKNIPRPPNKELYPQEDDVVDKRRRHRDIGTTAGSSNAGIPAK
jgi:hypothetical protein